jgi:hypothetical protein
MQSAQSPPDAQRLLAAYEQQLQPRHVAGMLMHIVGLLQQQHPGGEGDEQPVAYGLESSRGATLQLGEWQPVVAQLSAWVHLHMGRLFYQHLASVAWAWAKMGWLLQPEQAQQLAEQVQQQGLDPSVVGERPAATARMPP